MQQSTANNPPSEDRGPEGDYRPCQEYKSKIVATNMTNCESEEVDNDSVYSLKGRRQIAVKHFDWVNSSEKDAVFKFQMEKKRLDEVACKASIIVTGSLAVQGFKHIWATSSFNAQSYLLAVYTEECKDELFLVDTETLEKRQLLSQADVSDLYVSHSKEIWLTLQNKKKIVSIKDNSEVFESKFIFKRWYINATCNTQYGKILLALEPFLFFITEPEGGPTQMTNLICRINMNSKKEETLSVDFLVEALGMSGDHLYALSTDNQLFKISPTAFKVCQKAQLELETGSFADILKGDGETLVIGVQNKIEGKPSLLVVNSQRNLFQREKLGEGKCRVSSLQFVRSKGARFLLVAAEWKHLHLFGVAGERIYPIQAGLEVHFTILYGIRPLHELYSVAQDDGELSFLVHGDYRMKKIIKLAFEL